MTGFSGSNSQSNILCFSSSDWHGKWGSRQQVMLRFARRGYRVLFFERPAGLEHLLRYPDLRHRKIRRWREGLRHIQEGLWISSLPPLLPGRYYSSAVNSVNQWLTIGWSRRQLHRLKFRSPILWLYKPEQGPLVGRFGEQLSVYHCVDEFTAGTAGRKRRTIAALERNLLERVDLVFANSRLTYENKRALNANTYRISSGADVEHFAQSFDPGTPVHPAVAALPTPIAGYLGNIDNRLDVPLLAAVAAHLHDWQFVLVGQPYPQLVDLRPLEALTNVHFLGGFPFSALPALVKGMDVCLIPYVRNELARYRSPLKLYEYLAAGKPIVSTDHPEACELSDCVKIADDPQGFAAAILRARMQDSSEQQQRRVDWSKKHSWDRRVDEMERILIVHLEEKRRF